MLAHRWHIFSGGCIKYLATFSIAWYASEVTQSDWKI